MKSNRRETTHYARKNSMMQRNEQKGKNQKLAKMQGKSKRKARNRLRDGIRKEGEMACSSFDVFLVEREIQLKHLSLVFFH